MRNNWIMSSVSHIECHKAMEKARSSPAPLKTSTTTINPRRSGTAPAYPRAIWSIWKLLCDWQRQSNTHSQRKTRGWNHEFYASFDDCIFFFIRHTAIKRTKQEYKKCHILTTATCDSNKHITACLKWAQLFKCCTCINVVMCWKGLIVCESQSRCAVCIQYICAI